MLFRWRARVNDPRVGYVEGARELRAFVSGTVDWLRERDAVVENVALARTQNRTVEEVVLHLLGDEGRRVELPVAIVTDRNSDRTLKTIRVYHSMWPFTGEHAVRPPLLPRRSRAPRRRGYRRLLTGFGRRRPAGHRKHL
jgi:hypothetical protein